MGLHEIIEEALHLKPQERYLIIENLVQSLNEPNQEIDQIWLRESLLRLEAYKRGEIKTHSYEEVFGK